MHADGGPGPDVGPETPLNVPKECAIKVFKTTLNEFKTREKYIRDDYRFKERFSKQNPRKIIHMWAEKELHNLMKMAKGGIR
jgi:RIO kinase 3